MSSRNYMQNLFQQDMLVNGAKRKSKEERQLEMLLLLKRLPKSITMELSERLGTEDDLPKAPTQSKSADVDVEQVLFNRKASVHAWLVGRLSHNQLSSLGWMSRLVRNGVVDAQIHILISAGLFGSPQIAMSRHYQQAHPGEEVPKINIDQDYRRVVGIIDVEALSVNADSFHDFSLPSNEGRQLVLVGTVVRSKVVLTSTRKRMMFISLDCEDNDIDVVVWPEAYERLVSKPKGGDIVAVTGKREFNPSRGVVQLVVGRGGNVKTIH